jgi:pimeloyl-ACP methyl ester carboxylesterase
VTFTPTSKFLYAVLEQLSTTVKRALQLKIDRRLLYGESWASTLILAYAQRHPDRVIGVILVGSR